MLRSPAPGVDGKNTDLPEPKAWEAERFAAELETDEELGDAVANTALYHFGCACHKLTDTTKFGISKGPQMAVCEYPVNKRMDEEVV
jgi:hypothetical protein